MKKSTLFFKVMVLLALLVPWTAWGQGLTDPGLPSGATAADIIGSRSMVLNPDGTIPGDDSNDGKNFKITAFNENLTGWTFTGTVHPLTHGLDDYLTVEEQQIKFKINKNKDEVTPTYSSLYFQIQNASGETKWVVYGFLPAGTTEIGTLTVSYNDGKGSRVYNGNALTAEEVKEGLTITAKNKNGEPIEIGDDAYTISVPENSIDKDIYTITVNITGEYAGVTTATTTFEITARPVTVTLDGLKLEKGANGTNLNASDYASYFKIEEDNNESKSGLVRGEKAKVTGTFDIDTQTVGDASFSTDDLDVVADNSKP